jgi:crotonobetainyl-CoA:carnitine CoA-transferase CaiB-like acyl-CoA transferase
MKEQPFNDLIVIDLASVLAGPSVGMFFAELGAKVIKVEHPTHKDVTRTWKLSSEDKDADVSAYFSSVNYGKEYQFLDLKTDDDREKLYQLCANADIVVMNFKHGDQEKLKITDELLRKDNPQLIIGKISGFGDENDRVAYDLILQAESGIMYMNGTKDSGPLKIPIALIDVLAAHHLKEGILISLLARQKNQKGKTVTVSLYDAAVSSLINQSSNYLMAGHIAQPIGSLHPNIAPYGELFTTKDHVSITFAIGSNRHFVLLCEELGLASLPSDDRFSTTQARVIHRTELAELLAEEIKQRNSGELLEKMHHLHVPVGKINTIADVLEQPNSKNRVLTELIEGVETKRVESIAFKIN